MNLIKRCAGILLHPTSLPGAYGIGELGDEAYRFVDWLVRACQGIWQVLPLGPTGFADSPYAAFSAFAGNPLLISLQRLFDEGLLTGDDFADYPFLPSDRVDYGAIIPAKMAALRRAYERWKAQTDEAERYRLDAFRAEQGWWLEDFALFMALKGAYGGRAWTEWDRDLIVRKPDALQYARQQLADEVQFHVFLQHCFVTQWSDLKHYANERGIRIMGDMPIFVAHDSADVWAHPEMFYLDTQGNPTFVAGVPPDYFSPTGQRWGNPVYRWDVLKRRGYRWWVERFRWTLHLVDMVRVDHFRGFAAYWRVPASEPTAVRGEWVKVPGKELFRTLKRELGELPVVAEDLGTITADVVRLRQSLGLPGMRVLQFAFDGNPDNPYLPYNYEPNTVVYTGTHDNDTLVGWFAGLSEQEKWRLADYIGREDFSVHWEMIRLAYASVARVAIIPLQDWLGLGSEARMNMPGREEGNWQWRCQKEYLSEGLAEAIAKMCRVYGRKRC
ncbi:MAG: 4-alpha-glucanotransferase [Armatimonadota bacterium]|nr:MAG: 4-alpha-glucanotransferase [Armatimonadota bacterium]